VLQSSETERSALANVCAAGPVPRQPVKALCCDGEHALNPQQAAA
jgi:hypothetical protein